MSNNKHPEVIDPEDKRYKDDDYFKETKESSQKTHINPLITKNTLAVI